VILEPEKLPYKKPVAPCLGWLAHNTQACSCYAEEKAKIRAWQALPWWQKVFRKNS
jgi:hypothetical protein